MDYKYCPKISIVIPAYNAANYLDQAIESALAQTYKNTEIIVVNDGSKDSGATRAIALSYGEKIRYFEKENGGSSSALNMGISKMTGEWFSWLSHDDLYTPDKLEEQVQCINSMNINQSNIQNHIFFSSYELIDAKGNVIRKFEKRKEEKFASKINGFQHNGFLIAEPSVYTFHGCSCLVHKSLLLEAGCFDEKLRLINDADLWFRLFAKGCKVHYIPKALVKGRIHEKQISRSIGFSYHNSEQDIFWNRSLEWLLSNYPEDKELFFRFGKDAYLKTRNSEGQRAFGYINSNEMKKVVLKAICTSYALIRQIAKNLCLKFKL